MFARIALSFAVLSLVTLSAWGQEETLQWEKTLAAAMARAKETGKNVFADFTSEVN